jgi:HNH endonuclease
MRTPEEYRELSMAYASGNATVVNCHRMNRPNKNQVLHYLAIFWREFRCGSEQVRLELLLEMADACFGEWSKLQRSQFRTKMDDKKRKFDWGNCRLCRRAKAQLLHHIVQLQNGGHNHRLNLISLCHDCHKKIHPWLQ